MPGPQRRDALLDACREIVDGEGFAAVTLGRVAADCGVSRTVIYQQFGDLAGMLVALIDREILRAGQTFGRTVAGTRGWRDGVSAILDAVGRERATWRLFLLPSAGAPPELADRLAWARSGVRAYLLDSICGDVGENPSPRADAAARLLHAYLDELVRLRVADPDRFPTAMLVEHLDGVLPGFLAPMRERGDPG
ncbi:hypothetical protein BHQ15_17360 [Mycolicibacillus koreensis]|nr:hypothetical protein BHQ15_17360 [Mycolicibacillus koreensis]